MNKFVNRIESNLKRIERNRIGCLESIRQDDGGKKERQLNNRQQQVDTFLGFPWFVMEMLTDKSSTGTRNVLSAAHWTELVVLRLKVRMEMEGRKRGLEMNKSPCRRRACCLFYTHPILFSGFNWWLSNVIATHYLALVSTHRKSLFGSCLVWVTCVSGSWHLRCRCSYRSFIPCSRA